MGYIAILGNILGIMLDIIFPRKCLVCTSNSQHKSGICGKCFSKINFNNTPYCPICGKGFAIDICTDYICGGCTKQKPKYSKARFIIKYDDHSKPLIAAFKYKDKTILSDYFAQLLINRYYNCLHDIDYIIPVPMHRLKRIYRLYNQTQYLANSVSKITGIPTKFTIMTKSKMTKSQASLKGKARQNNLKHSFAITNPDKVKGKNILLIDDVITTGSTISECVKILTKAGSKSVTIFAIAATNRMC